MFPTSDYRLSDLPGSLQEICSLIGFAATLLLVQTYGGTRLYIARTYSEDHRLSALIGHTEANLLASRYAGHWLDVPRATGLYTGARNRAILANPEALSVSGLARLHGLHLDTIKKIRAAARRPEPPIPTNVIALPVRRLAPAHPTGVAA